MKFHLYPRITTTDLGVFRRSSIARLQYLLQSIDWSRDNLDSLLDVVEDILEKNNEMDVVGHFVLQFYCVYNEEVKELIVSQETFLFLFRYDMESTSCTVESCASILTDIITFREYYSIPDPINQSKKIPYSKAALYTALETLCSSLQQFHICDHLKSDCYEGCQKYKLNVPFEACTSVIKYHDVTLKRGFVTLPCSRWHQLMKELYRRHYEFVVSLLSSMISDGRFVFDSRWLKLFEELDIIYSSFNRMNSRLNQTIHAQNVDQESDYFPPCMTNLLAILRDQHRLSYYWRYVLGGFLRDIGMPLNDAIQFWKSEYSKKHLRKTRCRHTWEEHSKKYIYSVKHQYGLIGDRKIRKTKPCVAIQDMRIGLTEEGGCPFSQFDDDNLMEFLAKNMPPDDNVSSKIMQLKKEGDCSEACSLYMRSYLRLYRNDECRVDFESPVGYYFALKSCVDDSLSW